MHYPKQILFTILTVLCFPHTHAQTTLQASIITENNYPIPQARVIITSKDSNDEHVFMTSDDGIIQSNELDTGKYEIRIEALAYQAHTSSVHITKDTSLIWTLHLSHVVLDEIAVVAYRIPLINKTGRKPKPKPVKKDCAIDSTREEGQIHGNEVITHLRSYMTYPKYAIAEEQQGKVYALFRIDKEGNITDLKLKKSTFECMDNMVLSALHRLPRISLEKDIYGREKHDEQQWYLLPVNFVLE